MKRALVIVAILLASVLIFAEVNIVQAQWSALSSGYAVTTDWHGKEVPIGESVTVWAGTTDSKVIEVQFLWKDPKDNVVWNVTVPVFGPYTTPNVPPGAPPEIVEWANKYPGKTVWYAKNTQVPDALGDWGVQAIFRDSGKIKKGKSDTIVAIRATSFFVVPEATTIVTLLSMFGAMAFAIKRKKIFHF